MTMMLGAIALCLIAINGVQAQVDSLVAQITASVADSLPSDLSGNGRYLVFVSNGDLSTQLGNRNNSDGNREIYLFDYAQRRIFQITNTKSRLVDTAVSPFSNENIRALVTNVAPVISNDGRWIVFSSNANSLTYAMPPGMPNASTPGNFDANTLSDADRDAFLADGNTEIWRYQIPVAPDVDLSTGAEPAFVDLSQGSFDRLTNTPAVLGPTQGTTSAFPQIEDDNRNVAIDDDASVISWVSTRDLLPFVMGNPNRPGNADGSPEVYVRVTSAAPGVVTQITDNPLGPITDTYFTSNPSLSGLGDRLLYTGNGTKPARNTATGANADKNTEIFITDLTPDGEPNSGGVQRQVTTTAATNPGDIVNVLSPGRRLSRDGNWLGFESTALLTGTGANATTTTLFLYKVNAAGTAADPFFRQIGARGAEDTGAIGGDYLRMPVFTDYDVNRVPGTLVFTSRLNFKVDGTIPTTAADGLNPNVARAPQIYSKSLGSLTSNLVRLTKITPPDGFASAIQPFTSNSVQRTVFSLGGTELGGGNADFTIEAFYLLIPTQTLAQTGEFMSFSTGASSRPVVAPAASPTPTPTPTPTPSPSPSPTPTPSTPPTVPGLSPGMLAVMHFSSGISGPFPTAVATGASNSRRFPLPVELGGASLSIDGAAAGMYSIDRRQVVFVVPPGTFATQSAGNLDVVLNVRGVVIRGKVVIVPVQPDLFSTTGGNLGQALSFNATNLPLLQPGPFFVTTVRLRGGRRVATVVRILLTGVQGVPQTSFNITVNNVAVIPSVEGAVPDELPGYYHVDFALPPSVSGAGDVPVEVSVAIGALIYASQADDKAPRIQIIGPVPTTTRPAPETSPPARISTGSPPLRPVIKRLR
jgi:uncharacterized protein (TIGR03437 family)